MTPHATIRTAKLFDIDPIEALRMRYRYLLDCLVETLSGESDRYWITDLCHLREVVALGKKLGKKNPAGSNDITDEMIQQAMSVPIDSIVEFIRGHTTAICHDDKRPSAFHGTRTNKLVCPVCDTKYGPIDVLMVRDGLSFPAAVLQLQ